MFRGPPGFKPTDTHCPYTKLFGSGNGESAADSPASASTASTPTPATRSLMRRAGAGRARDSATKASARRRTTETTSIWAHRSEEHTSELQSLMRISYAVFCLKKKKNKKTVNKIDKKNTNQKQ